jgi:catechol 2,3-dioxygenase-like lactoylglutathione lyase family enzyme
MPQAGTRLAEIARVIITVSDQDKALEFYVGTLGLEKIADEPYGDGDRWIEVAPPGTPTAVALAAPMGGPVGAMTGISFRTDDVDALHADFEARGVDVDEILRPGHPAPAMFFFRDRDGNTLHVAEG